VARVYRLTFQCTGANAELIQPSLHYQTDVPPAGDEPDPNDVAAGVWGVLGTQFLACFHNEVNVHDLVALEETLPPAIGVAGLHHVGLAGTLTGAGDWLPEGLVPLINIHTDTRSRSARGWVHMPNPRYSNFISNNVWSGGVNTALDAFAAKLDDSFDLGAVFPTHVNPVVYSRTRRSRGEDPFTFRVTGATARRTVAFLRSRMTTP